jgi:uncharacterized SAM-binding protein YcdF (DUF218 family)
MFASNLCYRPFTDELFRLPLSLDFSRFGWRKQLLIVAIGILAVFVIRWLSQNKRLRRWFISPKGFLLLFGFTVIIPLMIIVAEKALVLFLPTDSGAVANAIVVLGRGGGFEQQRVDEAFNLWQAKRAPIIFASGIGDAPSMIEQLQAKGIPKQALDGENCSLTTWENAVFTAAVLLPRGNQRIVLITDAPHMRRSLLVYQALGFTVIPHTVPLPPGYSFKGKAFVTVREYMGLVGYSFRGLFSVQHLTGLKNPELVNLLDQAKQYSQQKRFQEEGANKEKLG